MRRSRLADYWLKPYRDCVVTSYDKTTAKLPRGAQLRIAIVSDIHASTWFMSEPRLRAIVAQTNALTPDLILLPGDFSAEENKFQTPLPLEVTMQALSQLKAPLGRFAVMGNHDWWDDPDTQTREQGPCRTHTHLDAAGLTVMENTAHRLDLDGAEIWLAGLGCQTAFWRPGNAHIGTHDLDATLAPIPPHALHLLMAHEPDIFPDVPSCVDLTLSGHTHGGQVRIFGTTPVVPSRYGSRYAYGRYEEGGKTLIVSGGLGCSKAPLRLGVVPEIVEVIVHGV